LLIGWSHSYQRRHWLLLAVLSLQSQWIRRKVNGKRVLQSFIIQRKCSLPPYLLYDLALASSMETVASKLCQTILWHSLGRPVQENILFSASVLALPTVGPILPALNRIFPCTSCHPTRAIICIVGSDELGTWRFPYIGTTMLTA